MKKAVFLLAISMSFMAFAQTHDLPQAVRNSFDKLFPNSVINSWTDNGFYNYQSDWNDDSYYGDFNFDGYPEEFYNGYYSYSSPYIYNGGITSPYYNYDDYYNGYEYNIPENYVPPTYNSPTQYQVNFNFNGANMTAIFKPNGTFIIAKGSIGSLPAKVQNAVMSAFKGQTFRLGTYLEEMITQDYPTTNPVYRVKVKIKHGDNHILKVDASGKIVSNNKI